MVELILDVCAMVAEVALGGQGHSFCGNDSVVVVMWGTMMMLILIGDLEIGDCGGSSYVGGLSHASDDGNDSFDGV